MKTVEHLLDELDINLEDLAKRAGLELERTLAIADGRWTPSPKEREKLAAALGSAGHGNQLGTHDEPAERAVWAVRTERRFGQGQEPRRQE